VPEGHTIHRLAARHRKLFSGRPVRVSSPQGRFEAGAKALDGLLFTGAVAHGKHLLHRYEGDRTVHIHLGLYGKVTDGDGEPPEPFGEIRLRMSNDAHWLDLRGPTACELLDPPGVEALMARLGPDPLKRGADSIAAFARIARSSRPIVSLLMDQSIVAGVGLIFATEALYRAGIDPTTAGRDLPGDAWLPLWTDLRALMAAAVIAGRIDTVREEHTPEAMGREPRVDRHGGEVYVYRRTGQPCLVCGTPIHQDALGGRNLYWCPTCQS
jgi:endonuclease VIII